MPPRKNASRPAKKDKAAASSAAADSPEPNLSMAEFREKVESERSATGVLTSVEQSRDVKIESFSLAFHGRVLIENATLELNFGRRYGLIGANGSGKSTLLQCIAAREIPIPPHIDIHLLSREAEPSDMTCVQAVIHEAENELKRLEAELEEYLGREDASENPLINDLSDRIDQMDASTFEARAASLLHGLGFTNERMALQTKDLSGGWRMRVALAKALFVRPTLLLLDEPTNHLDLEACVWLEDYLAKYDRILVLVSHSQDFLNNVCTETIHLTHQRKLLYYGGNYDTFIKTREENEVNQMKAYEKQQADIEKIQRFVASAGTYANLVKQAKSKLKIIEKMDKVEKVDPPPVFKFKFENVDKLASPVLGFDKLCFSYNGKPEDCIYRDLDLGIDMDSRIALVGPNGAGKSTLLKLLMGELNPLSGRVTRHSHLKLGKYSQHSADQLDMEATPLEYLRNKYSAEFGQDLQLWRGIVGRYGITGNHQLEPIKNLSDGLKSRLVLAELVLYRPHILLLDEPTNHLDIETIDSLGEAIRNFSGGLVLVSHDFRLISQVADEIWLCERGQVYKYPKSIQQYKEELRKKVSK